MGTAAEEEDGTGRGSEEAWAWKLQEHMPPLPEVPVRLFDT